MKELTEMSWQELTKLREQLNSDLGEDDDDDDDDEDDDNLDEGDDKHEWIESDLIDALQALHEIQEAKQPAEKKGAPKSPPKGYPQDKGKYADPTNYKYPLDTETHVRAALSYFSKAKNRSGYSAQEQKFMWKRIIAATKKYGIELSDDVKKHVEALGNDSNSDGGEVKEELNDKEIIDLITKTIHEQMQQNPGGMLAQGAKGSGGMEAYQPQVRVPPDIEAINTQLEGFKQMHAKHEAANADMSSKVAALQKQVNAMNEAFTKMQQASQNGSEDDDGDDDSQDEETNGDGNGDGKDTEKVKAAKEAKGAKAASGSKAASTKKAGKDGEDKDTEDEDENDDDGNDDGDGKSTEKAKKKVKESMKQAHPEGLVATSDMAEGTGTNPPGFSAEDQDKGPRSFGDVMNRATRLRRRSIGA